MSFSTFRARKGARVVKVSGEDEEHVGVTPEVASSRGGESGESVEKPKPKKKAALSFVDEEEAEDSTFKIRKSSASRKLGRDTGAVSAPASLLPTVEESVSSSYSAEHLLALKRLSQLPTPNSPAAALLPQPATNDADLIPDAAKIHAARKLREKRRLEESSKAQGMDVDAVGDFVPLSGAASTTRTIAKADATKKESRLVTEEQDLGSGDEAFEDHAGDRIIFGAKDKLIASRDRKRAIAEDLLEAQEESASEEEGMKEWEREHIMKGGARRQLEEQEREREEEERRKGRDFSVPDTTTLPSLPSITSHLRYLLTSHRASLTSSRSHLAHLQSTLAASRAKSESIQHDLTALGERYHFAQETREWVSDLAEFLDEKGSELEKIEHGVREVKDEVAGYYRNVWKEVTDRLFGEFTVAGAVRPLQLHPSLEELLGRLDGPLPPDLALSTERKLAHLTTLHSHIFSDSLPAYSDLALVVARFTSWAEKHTEDFHRAYAGESLYTVVDLWVRWETVGRELKNTDPNFESTTWHRILSTLTFPPAPNSSIGADPDILSVLTKTVERTLTPHVKESVESWNPFDKEGTKRMGKVAEGLREYVGGGSDGWKSLSVALLKVLRDFADDLKERCDFTRYPAKVDSTARAITARETFWDLGYRILTALLHLRRHLPTHGARDVALKIVEGVLAPTLARSATFGDDLERVEKMLSSFPVDWRSGMLNGSPNLAGVVGRLETARAGFSEQDAVRLAKVRELLR